MKKRSSEIDAKLLQHAIRRTHDFESMLVHLFPQGSTTSTHKNKVIPTNSSSLATNKKSESPGPAVVTAHPMKGLISKCFEDYLSVFTAAQDTHLSDLLNRLVEAQKAAGIPRRETETGSVILSSSGDLFVFYKTAMQKCMEFSTSDKLLIDLVQILKKYLKEYANRYIASAKLTIQFRLNRFGLLVGAFSDSCRKQDRPQVYPLQLVLFKPF